MSQDPNDNKKSTEEMPAIDEENSKPTTDSLKKSTEETLSLKDMKLPRRKRSASDFVQKTTVIRRDNPILKRALNHQTGGGDEESGEHDVASEADDIQEREVTLVVRGMVERVMMREGIIYKVGRYELGLKNDDEIDLTPYGAMDRGVSRLHAQMHIEDGTLYVTDLGSTNGTYLGGERLDPDTPTALKKGDELLLGRLAIQVMYR